MNNEKRTCTKCGVEKELNNDNFKFIKNKFSTQCKICIKKHLAEWYQKNKSKVREQHTRYYEENKEQKKEYQEKNKKHIKQQRKKYRDENIEEYKERDRIYYYNNKDKRLEYNKNYNILNNEKLKEYSRNNFRSKAKFNTYDSKISSFEETRRDPNDSELLQVRCTYCGKWYNPTNGSINSRMKSLEKIFYGENNLYCSEECKLLCPTFSKKEIPDDHKKIKLENGDIKIVPKDSSERNYSNEVNPQFRKYIFELDNYECQRCGASKLEDETLLIHCHHINARKTHPHEECDPDNGITFCKECHKFIHSFKGCTYSDLANCRV